MARHRPRVRRLIPCLLAGLVAASALPASADAASVRKLRLRDAGDEILFAATICTKRKIRFRLKLRLEAPDRHVERLYSRDRKPRGCSRFVWAFDDDLEPNGRWVAKLKIRSFRPPWTGYSSDRAFHVY